MVSDIQHPPLQLALDTDFCGLADRLVVRRLKPTDALALNAAHNTNLEHLRPWMPWAAAAAPPAVHHDLLADWAKKDEAGVEYEWGVFDGEVIAAMCGAHARIDDGGFEIGYWVAMTHVGRGLATAVASAVADAIGSLERVDHIEIHHDVANAASGAIPPKLGFTLVSETPSPVTAPGEAGVELIWRRDT